jgi:hypothetical protein
MLEDCGNLNFERRIPDRAEAQNILATQAEGGEIPTLDGVRVFVAGASARSTQEFERIENFWLGYFNNCHATSASANYGHYLLNFPIHDDEEPPLMPVPRAPEPIAASSTANSSCAKHIAVGSTKSEVLAIAGDPNDDRAGADGSEYWLYNHGAFIRFNSCGTVMEFFNSGGYTACR